jgi:hypothetical protein
MIRFSQRSRSSNPQLETPPPTSCPYDLTVTDTTGWEGFLELELSALRALVSPDAVRYQPDSLGLSHARRSLASLQAPHDPSRWVLTASSSEAYGILFQLLCDPGTRVATPRPGYPLVDELGRFHDVSVAPIPMRRDGGLWQLDLGWTERRLKEGVRALVLIQPANPTGWVLSAQERVRVLELCHRYQVPLISDEVFEAWAPSGFQTLASQDDVLCFTLGGLSKRLGLPHLKLGWIRVSGPAAEVQEAMERLAILNDALLSASTPVQVALPWLLQHQHTFQERIQARLERNRRIWTTFGLRVPEGIEVLGSEAGWFGIVQWNRPWSESSVCQRLLDRGIKVSPGYLFDLPDAGFVVSLISASDDLVHALNVLEDLFISLDP